VERVAAVGGGLYPRTALLLGELLPHVQITVIDQSAANLERARSFLSPAVSLVQQHYEPEPADFDLVVIPLAYCGDREAVYKNPPARAVLIHDWIWKRRGTSCVVSLLLLKRVNLILR
jgi:hypothetical protein